MANRKFKYLLSCAPLLAACNYRDTALCADEGGYRLVYDTDAIIHWVLPTCILSLGGAGVLRQVLRIEIFTQAQPTKLSYSLFVLDNKS